MFAFLIKYHTFQDIGMYSFAFSKYVRVNLSALYQSKTFELLGNIISLFIYVLGCISITTRAWAIDLFGRLRNKVFVPKKQKLFQVELTEKQRDSSFNVFNANCNRGQ